jgi:hypothetical protein
MIQRTTNPRSKDYPNYGGRGIFVCDRWRASFDDFLRDMGRRPKGTTLERRDNNKGYAAENCYWATRAEQDANKRTSRLIEFEGALWSTKALAKHLGVSTRTIQRRFCTASVDVGVVATARSIQRQS